MCIYICICIHTHVYVYVCITIHTHSDFFVVSWHAFLRAFQSQLYAFAW